ncbi:synaptotagmin-5-like [Zootoca vivipara]|uniref:synaptotagmin-5-like n=1 Tax=Zootoca vivipara TaxID=8524 RepID=UPI00293BD578|nr:synaptotagmin-5-like [Zootoca vivipara]
MALFKDYVFPALSLCQSIVFFFCKGMIEGLVVLLFLWLLVQVLLDKHQQVHLQVFLGVGLALLCFCLLLGCAICWHRRRTRRPDCGEAQASSGRPLVDLGPVLPSPTTAVPIQQQYAQMAGQLLESLPAAAAREPASPDGSPPTALLRSRASLPSLVVPPGLSAPPAKRPRGPQRRSTIAAGDSSLLAVRPVAGLLPAAATRAKPRPRLHFAVGYSPPEATLTVNVVGVAHLPGGLGASRSCYVEARLLPGSAEPQRTARRRRSLHPEFHEQLRFPGCARQELPGLTLRLAVYAKAFARRKDAFVGEVLFPCAQVAGELGASPSAHAQELSLTKVRLRKCHSCQDMSSASWLSQPKSLGQLFLLLQYQALANRIKVLVRKAENLGRVSRMLGTPDHYVLIHLCHDGKVIDTKETKSIAGYNPVWNAPFLFSLPAGDIQEQQLSLEFTVMQARLYARSCAVGRVLIGPVAPEMGQVHWKEMCSRGNMESARWHAIQSGGFQLCP